MSMLYSDWVTALGGYLPENINNANLPQPFIIGSRYNAVIARCIEYAELKMYRDPDLDFLAIRTPDGSSTTACAAGTRAVAIPTGMVVVESVNVITPAGSAPGATGTTRTPLTWVSVPFINRAWPTVALQQQPEHVARTDDGNVIVGATPDQAYTLEFYGTVRPTPLSYTNVSTILTLNFPDLFLAASMIFMSGYQKTFGAMSGDPQQGMTWNQYYEELKKGAQVEEARKKSQSAAWTPMVPTPIATPPRQ